MPWRMEDGSGLPRAEWESNIDNLLDEWRPEPRPCFQPPLVLSQQNGATRQICCAGPYFALERWGVAGGATLHHRFTGALILSNLGASASVRCRDWSGRLERAESLLLPAASPPWRWRDRPTSWPDICRSWTPISASRSPQPATGHGRSRRSGKGWTAEAASGTAERRRCLTMHGSAGA